MLEVGISQAQSQFTKLLNKSAIIVDKKTKSKKAVILPFEEYQELVKKAKQKDDFAKGVFSKYVGILNNEFETDDVKYNEIVKGTVKWKSL